MYQSTIGSSAERIKKLHSNSYERNLQALDQVEKEPEMKYSIERTRHNPKNVESQYGNKKA